MAVACVCARGGSWITDELGSQRRLLGFVHHRELDDHVVDAVQRTPRLAHGVRDMSGCRPVVRRQGDEHLCSTPGNGSSPQHAHLTDGSAQLGIDHICHCGGQLLVGDLGWTAVGGRPSTLALHWVPLAGCDRLPRGGCTGVAAASAARLARYCRYCRRPQPADPQQRSVRDARPHEVQDERRGHPVSQGVPTVIDRCREPPQKFSESMRTSVCI